MIKDPRLIFVAFTLNMLVRNYGFMPNVDNFVCIVDKLDIHGSKNKAKRVIYGVQFGAHSTKHNPHNLVQTPTKTTHGYFILERMAASLLLEKAYTKSLVYVLLSNIYASVGFEDETNLDNEKGSDFIAMVIALRISDTLSLILCQEPNYTSSHSSNRPH
jgi:hypothetical protein